MTLKQLQYFIATVDCGFSMVKAGEKVYTSQPGISNQLGKLAYSVGGPLFEKNGCMLEGLTPRGKKLLPLARIMIETMTEAKSLKLIVL